jgi:hypothetical protein
MTLDMVLRAFLRHHVKKQSTLERVCAALKPNWRERHGWAELPRLLDDDGSPVQILWFDDEYNGHRPPVGSPSVLEKRRAWDARAMAATAAATKDIRRLAAGASDAAGAGAAAAAAAEAQKRKPAPTASPSPTSSKKSKGAGAGGGSAAPTSSLRSEGPSTAAPPSARRASPRGVSSSPAGSAVPSAAAVIEPAACPSAAAALEPAASSTPAAGSVSPSAAIALARPQRTASPPAVTMEETSQVGVLAEASSALAATAAKVAAMELQLEAEQARV